MDWKFQEKGMHEMLKLLNSKSLTKHQSHIRTIIKKDKYFETGNYLSKLGIKKNNIVFFQVEEIIPNLEENKLETRLLSSETSEPFAEYQPIIDDCKRNVYFQFDNETEAENFFRRLQGYIDKKYYSLETC